MDNLKIGLSHELEIEVTEKETALALKSGNLRVFGTPCMIALMEFAATDAVENFVGIGNSTVGIKVDIEHIKATPVGMKVKVCAKLVAIDGKKLSFDVEAFDEEGKIGFGKHERFIVNVEKFINKTYYGNK